MANIFLSYYIENEVQNELDIHSEVIFNIEKRFEEQNIISNSIINGINTQPEITNEIYTLTTSSYEEYLSYKLDRFLNSNKKTIDLKYLLDTMLSNRKDVLGVVVNDKNKEYKTELVLNHMKWYDLKQRKENIRKITKPIKNIDSMHTIGYIDIYFDLNELYKLLKNSNLKGDLIISDESKKVIFNYKKDISKYYIDEIDKEHNLSKVDKIKIKSILNKEPIVNIKEDAQTKFKYMSLLEYKDLELESIGFKIWIISFICIFIIILITYLLIQRYSLKLKNMIRCIGLIQDGNLDTRFNIEKEDDELDMIAIKIDKMSEILEYNINKNYISEVKQKQAEINALQAQINPHFLYNMLEVIRMCALSSKNKEVAQMIYNLAGMFRYSTYNNGSMVSLNEEIKYCRMYLNLCCTRYRGIFEYDINIDEDLMKCMVPKFILQPIVENSINHGIKKDKNDNKIEINAIELDGDIKISIKDNGNGINEETLMIIKDQLTKNLQKTNSIGLMNINNRLKLKFGEKYGLDISSKNLKKTNVDINIPILKNEDGNV
ncbi:MAG: histidine kinase [Romboutsia sp.]